MIFPRVFLAGWNPDNIISYRIDHTKVLGDLADIPLLFEIGASVGSNSVDTRIVIDRLIEDANRVKIAIADADGVEQKIEQPTLRWSSILRTGYTVFKASEVSPTEDTYFFLYFDIDHADNTANVGDVGSTPGKAVYGASTEAHYNFEEDPTGGGSPVLDSGPNGFDLENVGMGSGDLVDAVVGKGLDFSSVPGGLKDVAGSDLELLGDMTVEVAVKPLAFPVDRGRIVHKGGLARMLYALTVLSDGRIRYEHQTATTEEIADMTDVFLSLGVFTHVAVTRNTTAKTVDFLIDGEFIETVSYSNNPNTTGGTFDVGFTNTGGGPLLGWDGVTDQLTISTGRRGRAWVKARYHSFFAKDLASYSILHAPSCVQPTTVVTIPESRPDTVVEVDLTDTRKFGGRKRFDDITVALGNITDGAIKISQDQSFADTRTVTFDLIGRANFINILADEFIKNRAVRVLRSFDSSDPYSNYMPVFSGVIFDAKRSGDRCAIVAMDSLGAKANVGIPFDDDPVDIDEGGEASDIQSNVYSNNNAIDIMLDILTGNFVQDNPNTSADNDSMSLSTAEVDTVFFEVLRDLWFSGVVFNRVLVKPVPAKKLLNQIMEETNSYIVNNGSRFMLRPFVPLILGGTVVKEYSDATGILEGSISHDMGFRQFFNKIKFFFDYDESGSEESDDPYESVYIKENTDSSGASEQDETKVRTIRSKWIKSLSYEQPIENNASMTGVILYYLSKNNGAGEGTLFYDFSADTLQWTAPGGSIGPAVDVGKNGTFQLKDSDETKFVRVAVKVSVLPITDQTSNITIVSLNGLGIAQSIAVRYLNRYADTVANVTFQVDLNDVEKIATGSIQSFADGGTGVTVVNSTAHGRTQGQTVAVLDTDGYNGVYVVNVVSDNTFTIPVSFGATETGTWQLKLRTGDFIELTTGEVSLKGKSSLSREQMMVTSLKSIAGKHRYEIQAVQTKLTENYAVISPSTVTAEWDDATEAEKQFCYVGDTANNQLGINNDPGFVIL